MCKWCLAHGDGKKWYENAKNYSNELAEELNLKEYLTEQWMNFETVFIRKIMGFSSIGLGYKMRTPIIGRILRNQAENMIHSEKKHRNPVRADGHFGQIIPLEDAQMIMGGLAAEPIILNYCMCRWMQRGIKEAVCINFGILSEVIEKLPRFIPEGKTPRIDRETAIEKLEEFNKQGKVASVWFQPVPYINAICSCENPQCGGLRLRRDFGLHSVYKAEYVAGVNADLCEGCKKCVSMCQFNAITFSPTLQRAIINPENCFGCGNCRHACNFDAISLKSRNEIPILEGRY